MIATIVLGVFGVLLAMGVILALTSEGVPVKFTMIALVVGLEVLPTLLIFADARHVKFKPMRHEVVLTITDDEAIMAAAYLDTPTDGISAAVWRR